MNKWLNIRYAYNGRPLIDLRVETIVKDNSQILDLMEKIKPMGGINDAVCSEVIRVVGKKISVPSYVID
jgi:hypothetical protein